MLRLILDTQHVTIRGASLKVLKKLEHVTSYLVAGHYMSPAFRARRWDGREHLMVHRGGRRYAPIGLYQDIRAALDEAGVEYVVKRRRAPERERVEYVWNDTIKLRPYQKAAVRAFCAAPDQGRGILKMPIRSGKTKTAARIIYRLQARTLFMVPSQMLLHQTAESLAHSLPGAEIGVIGDGEWQPGDVTVATVQSLVRARGGTMKTCKGNALRDEDTGMLIEDSFSSEPCPCSRKRCKGGHRFRTPVDPRYTELMESHDLVVFDECHHLSGSAWHDVFMDSPARFRLGLSATVFLDHAKEVEKGVIWLKACCGGVKYEVEMSNLIEQGFLLRQHVQVHKVEEPKGREDEGWSKALPHELIYTNEYRNRLIIKLAQKALADGYRNVLLATSSLHQVRALDALLDSAGLDHGVIVGATPKPSRKLIVEQLKRGDFQVLLGTVLSEGVDIPEIECVINAEGGLDIKKTIQRMRNLTPAEGKTRSLMIDFWDATNTYLRKHSRARLKTYKSESAFKVEEMWRKKGSPATRKRR
ncbi:MAG: DEAD/DEAH box helicase [Acidimicrobiia bacterium]